MTRLGPFLCLYSIKVSEYKYNFIHNATNEIKTI